MLVLDAAALDQLYPCRLFVNAAGEVEQAGPSMLRLSGPSVVGKHFDDVFVIERPRGALLDALYGRAQGAPTTIEFAGRAPDPMRFRGAFVATNGAGAHVLAAAAPVGAASAAGVLRYIDFAPTDGAVDLLLAMQAREASVQDARRLAERLEAVRGLEEASLAKSRFIAGMSHELRTPLNAIIGYAEMAIEDMDGRDMEQTVADVRQITAASTHLLGLIGDILDLAKIEAGRMEIVPEQVDIEQVVRAAGATAEPLARKGANRLLVEAERGLAGVWTDPAKVRQCVLNLLSNAAKFTVEGDITLRAAPGQRNGARVVVISVNDTGIGMSDEELQRLFQPFVQATSSTSTRYGGTGLGLSITRQICQLLGGDVEVESVRGVGSRFTMFFPLIMYADRPDAVGQCA